MASSSSSSAPVTCHSSPVALDQEVEEADVEKSNSEGGILESDGESDNPMKIDLVLETLFGSCLEFEDLASCRLVSQQWFQLSLPDWLKKGPKLKLHLDPSLEYLDRGWKDMSKFLQMVHSDSHSYEPYEFAGLRQYQNFELNGDLKVPVQRCLLELFLRKVGDSITDLKSILKYPDLESYGMVMLSDMSPNLVKLDADIGFRRDVVIEDGIYDDIITPGGGDQQQQRKLTTLQIGFNMSLSRSLPLEGWVQLLQRYPNLKTLLHGVRYPGSARDVDRMLEAISNIRQVDKKMLDLKRLEIVCTEQHTMEGPPPLTHFQEAGLALETLSISFDRLTPASTFRDILASQAPTLKHLTIHNHNRFEYGGGGGEGIPFPPKLDSVETLELHGFPTVDLTFLQSFVDNLKTLRIVEQGPQHDHHSSFSHVVNWTKEEELDGLVVRTLSQLLIDQENGYEGEALRTSFGAFEKLRRVMPNLVDVRMCLNNESFRALVRCWPQLEHLVITGNEVDDGGLINGIADSGDDDDDESGGNIEDDITSLKALKSFKMIHVDHCYCNNAGPVSITGNSASAFLELPKLEKLEITVKQHDKEAFAALRDKIKSVKITVAELRWRYPVVKKARKPAPLIDFEDGSSSGTGSKSEQGGDDGDGEPGDNNGQGESESGDAAANDTIIDHFSCCGCTIS